jgi:hypothetical protein
MSAPPPPPARGPPRLNKAERKALEIQRQQQIAEREARKPKPTGLQLSSLLDRLFSASGASAPPPPRILARPQAAQAPLAQPVLAVPAADVAVPLPQATGPARPQPRAWASPPPPGRLPAHMSATPVFKSVPTRELPPPPLAETARLAARAPAPVRPVQSGRPSLDPSSFPLPDQASLRPAVKVSVGLAGLRVQGVQAVPVAAPSAASTPLERLRALYASAKRVSTSTEASGGGAPQKRSRASDEVLAELGIRRKGVCFHVLASVLC